MGAVRIAAALQRRRHGHRGRRGRIVGVRGRAVDRVNHGRLDPKDLYGWQAKAVADRLRPSGARTAASWSRPTGTPPWAGLCSQRGIARTSRARARSASTRRGQLFLEEYYTLAVIAQGGDRHPAHGRQHPPVHGDRCCGAEGASAATANPVRTPTSITPTPSRSTATTWPRPRPSCGCGCSIGWPARIRRLMVRRSAETPVAAQATCTSLRSRHQRRADECAAACADRRGLVDHGYVARTPSAIEELAAGRAVPPGAGRADLRRRRPDGFAMPRRDHRHLRSGWCRRCCRASTSPIRRPRRPCRSTTSISPRNARQAGRGRLADERATDRAEHPRVRRRRRPARLPQLGQRRPHPELAELWNVDGCRSRTGRRRPTRCRSSAYAEQGSIELLWISATNPAVSMPDLGRIRVDARPASGCSWSCRTSS